MLGDKALELVKELYRMNKLLPKFDDVLLRQVFDEMEALNDQNMKDISMSMNDTTNRQASTGIYFRHTALERNKQCVLAYIYNRLKRIERSRWVLGAVIPEDMRSNMSPAEKTYSAKYNLLVSNYCSEIADGIGLDITQHTLPPQSASADVKVLKDFGEFETEMGDSILLKKNTTHSLPISDCEMLAKQGVINYYFN